MSQNSEQNKRQTHTHIHTHIHIMPGVFTNTLGEGAGEAVWVQQTDTNMQMPCVVCGNRHRGNTHLHTHTYAHSRVHTNTTDAWVLFNK